MELLVLKLGPNKWFKKFDASRNKETTSVLEEAHFFPPSQLQRITREVDVNETSAQICSVEISEPTVIWDYQTGRAVRASTGASKMNLGGVQLGTKPRDEILKWADSHSGKVDVWTFAQEHSVSYHAMLKECQSLVTDGYLWPLQESLAVCRLTPKGEAAASALS